MIHDSSNRSQQWWRPAAAWVATLLKYANAQAGAILGMFELILYPPCHSRWFWCWFICVCAWLLKATWIAGRWKWPTTVATTPSRLWSVVALRKLCFSTQTARWLRAATQTAENTRPLVIWTKSRFGFGFLYFTCSKYVYSNWSWWILFLSVCVLVSANMVSTIHVASNVQRSRNQDVAYGWPMSNQSFPAMWFTVFIELVMIAIEVQ
jgi:hypothetical protein